MMSDIFSALNLNYGFLPNYSHFGRNRWDNCFSLFNYGLQSSCNGCFPLGIGLPFIGASNPYNYSWRALGAQTNPFGPILNLGTHSYFSLNSNPYSVFGLQTYNTYLQPNFFMSTSTPTTSTLGNPIISLPNLFTTQNNDSSLFGSYTLTTQKPSTTLPQLINFNTSKETPESNPNTSTNPTNAKPSTESLINGTYTGKKVNVFGITHYKYDDCKQSDLVSVPGTSHKLHRDCANAFEQMRKDAQKAGVNLFVCSGFRSKAYQINVFKKKWGNTIPNDNQLKARLAVSAPPGYSEHHTGLAVDICSTNESFKNTAEYKWLCANASKYGFELSFPKNGSQGLSFEPWHWRYVGTDSAKRIFADARNQA